MERPYKRPPITEAVIEVRLSNDVDMKTIEKLKEKFSERYPLPPIALANFNVDIGSERATVSQRNDGYRLTDAEGLSVVIITPRSIVTSRLAPYDGWESFFETAGENWKIWKRFVGWQPVGRIGVRFINRIDIKAPGDTPIEMDDYFNFSLKLPTLDESKMNGFFVQASINLMKEDFKVTINTGVVQPVLIDHQSFVLDIDLFRELNLAQNDKELWACINSARRLKNMVFEASITNRTREIFSR